MKISDVILSVIAYAPRLLSSYIIFFSAFNSKPGRNKKIFLAVSSVLIICVLHIISIYSVGYTTVVYILLSVVVLMMAQRKNYLASLLCTIISIGISTCFRTISSLIVSMIYWYIMGLDAERLQNDMFITVLGHFFIMILMVAMTLIFVRIKRFRKGFAYLLDKDNVGIGLLLSGLVISALFIVINADKIKNYLGVATEVFIPVIIGICVAVLGFVIWIRKGITNKYLEGLRKKELARYEAELQEKDRQIKNLSETNGYLSKIVHRDNHLIGSLAQAVKQATQEEYGDGQLRQLMSDMLAQFEQRSDLVLKEQYQHKLLPSTGLVLVDGALSNLLIKAAAHNISLDVSADADLRRLANGILSATELETLICDHIKDAIIAVETSKVENGRVLLQMSCKDGIYEISVRDNADDFDIEVLKKLGLERITTHGESGGSGIGFMTTFESLKKANASFILDEYRNKTPFTKAVTFRFDNLGGFAINSYRKRELKKKLKRKDVVLREI